VKLRIDVQQATFAPGDNISGEVVVLEGGRSRGATIELRFVERSQPFDHVAYTTEAPLTDQELTKGDVLPFALTLPDQALPSVYTDEASLLWELRVEVDVPLLPDQDERLELIVERRRNHGSPT
jgi:hypothetical protein